MKKKIIYISHWRFPSEKTMTPLILKTCEGFLEEGFDVELWIPKRPNPAFSGIDPFLQHGIKERFPIRALPVATFVKHLGKFSFLLMVFTFNISVYLRLHKERKNGSVILYGHDLRDFIFPSLLRIPLFVEIHDFYESSLRFLNRAVLARTSGLIVTNTFKQKALVSRYNFKEERMICQPNAVSYEMFDISTSQSEAREILGLPPQGKILLYTGHLFSWKGVYTLAEATPFLPHDTHVYFVGGTPEDRAALEKFVKEKNLPRIVFLPHQPHSKIPFFQKAADVLILPNTAKEAASKYETSPVKLFEYMASGVPIVASEVPSIKEIVSSKEVFFFTPDDPQSLASAVKEIFHTEKAKERTRASQVLAQKFSWKSRAQAIAVLIRKMA